MSNQVTIAKWGFYKAQSNNKLVNLMLTDFHVTSPITNLFTNILDVPNQEKTEFRCKVKFDDISRRKFQDFEKFSKIFLKLFLEKFRFFFW